MDIKIEEMTEKQMKELLKQLIEKLDNLDCDDFFGTEGWKHYLGFEYYEEILEKCQEELE